MADVHIDPFGEHDRTELRTDETGENIRLIPGGPGGAPLSGVGGSTWEPTCEQETSFRGESHRTKLMKDYVKDLYKKLSENIGESQNHFTMIILNSKVGNYTT